MIDDGGICVRHGKDDSDASGQSSRRAGSKVFLVLAAGISGVDVYVDEAGKFQ